MTSHGVLHNKQFLWLWIGSTVSLVGTSGAHIAYPLLVLTLSGSPVFAGWVAFAVLLPAILLQVPAGLVADHSNRRHVMLGCQAVGALGAALVTIGVYYNVSFLLAVLLMVAFVEGSLSVVFTVAQVAAIRDVVSEEQRASAFGWYETQQPSSRLVGRAIGSALFGVTHWLPFAVNFASYVGTLGTLLLLRPSRFEPRRQSGRPDANSTWVNVSRGFRWVWSIPFVRDAALIVGALNAVFQVVILVVIVAGHDANWPSWMVGMVLASTGVGGILGGLVAPRLNRRFPPRLVFAAGTACWALFLLMFATTTNAGVVALAWTGVGAVGAVTNVAVSVYLVEAVPDAVFGQAVGGVAMLNTMAVPLGPIVGGYLIDAWGTRATGWLLFCATLAVAIFANRRLRANRGGGHGLALVSGDQLDPDDMNRQQSAVR
ncbi:Predicted arabinose efflux permease, MFS family [Asanoa ishikariensis]|uniref:Predicted arabinose efflux permease, MFS family n=1 Tax=Asanoa ishikariensis TaxID=137265 RepID=A0A1H3US48_9ACTN|nr:MFS transporter [Asanoa ishikariensis]SDZ65177.1 Predicted arabinose efflux permease, MFS family [Asanoa ishikariensis]